MVIFLDIVNKKGIRIMIIKKMLPAIREKNPSILNRVFYICVIRECLAYFDCGLSHYERRMFKRWIKFVFIERSKEYFKYKSKWGMA